jgi:16S rRNA (guanine966-N2)-methyltransferase
VVLVVTARSAADLADQRAEEVRIVGGELRGRALATPRTQSIRPTTDRTREAVFNVLAHRFPEALNGRRVLDLFAGTGALGLEALSRGAASAVFIEEGAEGRGLIRENVEAFGLSGRTRIFRRDATSLGPIGTLQPFGLVFADPPYNKQLGEAALLSALNGGWLEPDALCLVEESAAASFALPQGFVTEDERSYGETLIRFIRRA